MLRNPQPCFADLPDPRRFNSSTSRQRSVRMILLGTQDRLFANGFESEVE